MELEGVRQYLFNNCANITKAQAITSQFDDQLKNYLTVDLAHDRHHTGDVLPPGHAPPGHPPHSQPRQNDDPKHLELYNDVQILVTINLLTFR